MTKENGVFVSKQREKESKKRSLVVYAAIILFGFVTALFLGATGYLIYNYLTGLYSDTSLRSTGEKDVDTSGWIKYSNDYFGFIIEHPSEWVEVVPDGNGDNGSYSFDLVKSLSSSGNDEARISIFLQSTRPVYLDESMSVSSVEIAGYNGIKLEGSEYDISFIKYLIKKPGDQEIYAEIFYYTNTESQNLAQIEDIISTIRFVDSGKNTLANNSDCVVSGCNGELCIEKGAQLSSSCEYKNYYVCYNSTVCERQANGECGFTETPDFIECKEAYTSEPDEVRGEQMPVEQNLEGQM